MEKNEEEETTLCCAVLCSCDVATGHRGLFVLHGPSLTLQSQHPTLNLAVEQKTGGSKRGVCLQDIAPGTNHPSEERILYCIIGLFLEQAKEKSLWSTLNVLVNNHFLFSGVCLNPPKPRNRCQWHAGKRAAGNPSPNPRRWYTPGWPFWAATGCVPRRSPCPFCLFVFFLLVWSHAYSWT